MAVRIKAYAKINLTLDIIGKIGQYHELDSLVATVDLFDYIILRKRKDKHSFVTMRGLGSESIPPEKNNAWKAAELFSQAFGVNGADITIYKNIPMGAGLGGSSADASGVLRGMAKLYKIDDEQKLCALADELGSDTRYMLSGGFARMRGRGTQIEKLPVSPTLHFLLVVPREPVSTAECYRLFDEQNVAQKTETASEKLVQLLLQNRINDGGRYLTNDLYAPAILLNKQVESALEAVQNLSPLGATMTGSGSGVIALFETKELCEWAKSRIRGKWKTMVIKTLDPQAKQGGWRNPFALSQDEIENTLQ